MNFSYLKSLFDANVDAYGKLGGSVATACEALLKPRWIVIDDEGDEELGFKIGPLVFSYYKWPDPTARLAREYAFRVMNKREFGEVIRPV